MKKVTKAAVCSLALMSVAACEPPAPLSQYSPVVDPAHVSQVRYNRDLEACRNIALKVEADYKQRQQKEMGQRLIAGLIVGALTGAVVGAGQSNQGDYIAAGAAYGTAAGAASNDYTYDLVKYGPRRVVDRCMTNRGYKILNDIGKG